MPAGIIAAGFFGVSSVYGQERETEVSAAENIGISADAYSEILIDNMADENMAGSSPDVVSRRVGVSVDNQVIVGAAFNTAEPTAEQVSEVVDMVAEDAILNGYEGEILLVISYIKPSYDQMSNDYDFEFSINVDDQLNEIYYSGWTATEDNMYVISPHDLVKIVG